MPTYTNQTLTVLQELILARLNEVYNSEIPALPSGTGGADTIIPLTALTGLINDVIAQMCRSCYPITGPGTFSLASGSTGFATVALNSFVTTDGSELHTPYALLWGTTVLKFVERPLLGVRYSTYLTDAAAAPLYWFRNQNEIGIYPYPSTGPTTVTAYSYIVPKMLSAGSDVTPLRADVYPVIVDGVCALVAAKALEDDSISQRAGVWSSEYDKGRQSLWEVMPSSVRGLYYPMPPMAQPQQPQGQGQ